MKYKFKAKIVKGMRGGAFVEIPFDVEKTFGTKGRVKVKVIFDGVVHYRGSLAPAHGKHVLGIRKEIREKLNKEPGNEISIMLEEDTEPRTVDVPEDLLMELKKTKIFLRNFPIFHTRIKKNMLIG